MQLDVDLSELQLAASKMNGLNGFLKEIRNQKFTYLDGLLKAVEYVRASGGDVIELPDDETKLVLNNDEAICFQPYPDIDLFYYES